MAQNKTVPTKLSVSAFLKSIKDPAKRRDCKTVMSMMRTATGQRAKMWGTSIIGFGKYDYHYDSGRSGTHMLTGVSPRAQNLTIYIMPGFAKYGAMLKKLGPHKTGKSCLYLKRLDDVDHSALAALIDRAVSDMNKKYHR